MIVDLGQSATRLDVSSGAAPLHYAASMCGECRDVPQIVRFLLDCGADPNLWQLHGAENGISGSVEGDAVADFNGVLYGAEYLSFSQGSHLNFFPKQKEARLRWGSYFLCM